MAKAVTKIRNKNKCISVLFLDSDVCYHKNDQCNEKYDLYDPVPYGGMGFYYAIVICIILFILNPLLSL